ncbi:hypothetical protein LguiA_023217 [Lonicera macranthoides]
MDETLQKYCGKFGWWQWRNFSLTSLAWTFEAFHTMVMIFADREPGWRCMVVDESGFLGCSSKARSVCGLKPGSLEWIGGPGSSTPSPQITGPTPSFASSPASAFVHSFLSQNPVSPTKRGAAGMSTFYFFSASIAILSELFPTMVRNAALGCATQAAQMKAILAPFVVVLGGGLPFAVMWCVGCQGCSYVLLARDVEPAIV